jgi:ABC-type antimicrobial peptide transport system permease subunit
MGLLSTMKLSSVASLLLGLLFGIIIILFVVVSILLIYSLLMISVETKTFENGVLRLLGLSKANCIQMILIQSFMFVIPSIICGYIGSIPALHFIYLFMFKNAEGVEVSPIPSINATVKALVLGLVIPIVSSILPI